VKPKSDNKVRHLSRFDEVGFVVDMGEEEVPKGYWKVVNRQNGDLYKELVDKELDSLNRSGTWDMVGKVEGEKRVSSKWVFKVKRGADGSVDKFNTQLIAHG
jgi:hypothetical protein